MIEVNVGNDFCQRLANRNKLQGDGLHTAVEFRKKYMSELDSQEAWDDLKKVLILDFSKVKRIGPSFANEAFAYFMKYTTPDNFFKKVEFKRIDEVVDLPIITRELESGYNK